MNSTDFPRRFVPASFDPSDATQIETVGQSLLLRDIKNVEQAEAWLLDFSELLSAIDEFGSRRFIDKSCHTDDPEVDRRFMQFVEEVEPTLKPLTSALQKRFLALEAPLKPAGRKYDVLTRHWQADADVYRDENVPLQTDETKQVAEFDRLSGAMMVEFEGKSYTLQQLARFQEEPDREVRERAWKTAVARRMLDHDAISGVFDQLVTLRDGMARNAGFADYQQYQFRALKRFDYGPKQCEDFAAAIEQAIVPLVRELNEQRKRDLKLESLRPWDLAVDPMNRPPLRPFEESDIDGFVTTTRRVLDKLSPALGEQFESLRTNGDLDLDSRKGKQPGGYQSTLNESRRPFIFMNAAGLHGDVQTLIHEGGHAFHAIAARDEPLMFLRQAPIEFCEVASMGMELLAAEHLGEFYGEAELARATRQKLEGVVRFFPWMAIVDQFQAWVYTHPKHSREERATAWVGLLDRFEPGIDHSGFESWRSVSWQRQMHFFHVPLYYVEYGIAQLGALQLWLKSKEDPRQALANYQASLKLGGTRPLPELFAAAGIHFDFSIRTLKPLIEAVGEELASLPK